MSSLWVRVGKNVSLWLEEGRKRLNNENMFLRFSVFKAFSGERNAIQIHGISYSRTRCLGDRIPGKKVMKGNLQLYRIVNVLCYYIIW